MEVLFAKGGWVSILILIVSFVNLGLFIRVRTFLPILKKNILSRLQDENKQNPDLKSILEDSEEFFRRNFFVPETMISWIRNLAGIATMLGLLGTVIGISVAFEEMKNAGTVSLEIFSEGIRLALNTTIQGLCVAIPSVLGFQYLKIILHKTEIELKSSIDNKNADTIKTWK
ncbi:MULTISPECIES: MotA/TolQ/ExbB proton channel family protein [Leptospira]|uniref:Transporter, MotA/TolQ/ExbB proton channel family protein n=4 Tax=Leptospira weilii TaxID=28184 RepID=A0A828YXE0_9LEPT|nr:MULTISPECIES: MotA/TolQ/ExbB proton channel family protein [Leptospira]EMM71611.1 transporter, MotA/TolQ/ExbB proton channel family protein [Leptospira weilii str. 2006001855]EKR62218.1 transporter, MotA/TolQ/ExbB proton channel family protein [Leptospira weilii str. 2006001853]EMJ64051.1 transporter, MotA/TolQ/ExbB proton channel family protein [Leptospira sp. P2653]EMN44634.1 transporter, MotA/TolQ/ExbB proton channel family protein [Leptospira weilii str. LNT 1234]EMN89200.1 transporter,